MRKFLRTDHPIARLCVLLTTVALVSSCGQKAEQSSPKVSEEMDGAEEGKAVAPVVPTVLVKAERLNSELSLPGQLLAYQDVPIHAKIEGYISWIGVDRGSVVRKGQRLIKITAPEFEAKEKEAEAKLSSTIAACRQAQSGYQSMVSKLAEVKAKLDADQLTYERLSEAAKTPGAVAKNEVDLGAKAVEGDRARVDSLQSEVLAAENLVNSQKNNVLAARKVVESVKVMNSYLDIQAPFDGVITERDVHEGSIVSGEGSRSASPLVRIQEKSILRLVVAVPEEAVSAIEVGREIPFTVPAFLGKTFTGRIARLGFALDQATRTMPVELDVQNADGKLEPGMFATVRWQLTRPYDTLFVPESAVTSDLKGTFVVRVQNEVSERVPVNRGQQMGKLIEVVGDLKAGDTVALKATDELKTGLHVVAMKASEQQIKDASKHMGAGGE